MTPTLYAHPFSSYCQKALIALYENATPFTFHMLGDAQAMAELEALWPMKRFPVLVDGDRAVIEATIIIEHLGLHHPGPVRLIPADAKAALEVRAIDRFFDNYIMTPQQYRLRRHPQAGKSRSPRCRRGAGDARHRLSLARRQDGGTAMGGGRRLQPCRLRRGAGAVLCRLDARDRRAVR
jgi:glutathione S-transferase